nr:predicted GPI-anchored protein 58 [Aegilops tauschii subsp. strangulata]
MAHAPAIPPSGDSPAPQPSAAPAACSSPQPAPASPSPPPAAPCPSSPAAPLDAASLRIRWADLADDDPVSAAAGAPIPTSPSRRLDLAESAAPSSVAPVSTSLARGSDAGSRRLRPTLVTTGAKGGALPRDGSRRRRRRSWGVAGRSELGSARTAWRPSDPASSSRPAAPRPLLLPLGSSTTPSARSLPFRPFIARFGTSGLQVQVPSLLRLPRVAPTPPSRPPGRRRRRRRVEGKPSALVPLPPFPGPWGLGPWPGRPPGGADLPGAPSPSPCARGKEPVGPACGLSVGCVP